jgi:hypothetical protein
MSLFGVTEDHEFIRQAQALIPDARLRDDLLSAAYAMLAYHPLAGRELGSGVRRLAYDIPPLKMTVIILYTVEQQNVTLHEIFAAITSTQPHEE